MTVAANSAIVAPTGLKFKITDTKLYAPVATLPKENDIKPLEKLKSGFKKTIKWNKYRSQITIQPQDNTVCSCHVTYAFQSESTLYSCLNVKELFARSRHEI